MTLFFERRIDPHSTIFTPASTNALLYPLHFTLPLFAWYLKPEVLMTSRPSVLAASEWLVAAGVFLLGAGYLIVRALFIRRNQTTQFAHIARPHKGLSETQARVFLVILLVPDFIAKLYRIVASAYFQVQLTQYGQIAPEVWVVVMMASNLGIAAYAFAAAQRWATNSRTWVVLSIAIWVYNFAYFLPDRSQRDTPAAACPPPDGSLSLGATHVCFQSSCGRPSNWSRCRLFVRFHLQIRDVRAQLQTGRFSGS